MDSIFCKKCLHGNPAYLQYCTNCNEDLLSQADADLFAPIDGESAPQPQPEISAEMLERKANNAKVLSFVTTILRSGFYIRWKLRHTGVFLVSVMSCW